MAQRRARDTCDDAERSFEQLYRGHRGAVYWAALRELGNVHDAEDVTQAAFVDAYRAVLGGTRPQAPRAWLLTIAENVRRRRFRTALRAPREEPLDADAALAVEESREQAGALLNALGTLTEEQREAFLLREITGLSYDEIAERTGATVGSVQMLLFRARKTLRDELEPPHVRQVLGPLTTVFSRFDAFALTPRAVGAVGAAVLAVGVSASVPAEADPPRAARSVASQLATVVSARTVALAGEVTTPKPAAGNGRTSAKAAPARVARRQPRGPLASVPAPIPAPRPEPALARWLPPLASSVPLATIPTPELPTLKVPTAKLPGVRSPMAVQPLLDALVEPLLEDAGAAGAAGASAPPLPVLPLDPLPPTP